MHRFEPTRTDGDADVVPAVVTALRGAIDRAIGAGIARDAILVDPGLGFGTTAFDCARLIAHVAALRSLGVPILVGPSRKSFLGRFTGRPVDARLPGTAAAVAALALARVEVIRVHDVAEMHDVVKVIDAIHAAGAAPSNR